MRVERSVVLVGGPISRRRTQPDQALAPQIFQLLHKGLLGPALDVLIRQQSADRLLSVEQHEKIAKLI